MNVEAAAGGDVVKRADAGSDHVCDEADEPERDQKPERGQEQPLAPLALEMERVELGENLQPARDRFRRVLRAISSSMMAKAVRDSAWMWPWNARVQCAAGHLGTESTRCATSLDASQSTPAR